MSAAHLHPVPDRASPDALASKIDAVRLLVEIASAAAANLSSQRRAPAVRMLLDLIDDRLCALCDDVLPGGGA